MLKNVKLVAYTTKIIVHLSRQKDEYDRRV